MGDITLESYIDSRVQAKITELTNRIAVLESYHTTADPDNPEQTE